MKRYLIVVAAVFGALLAVSPIASASIKLDAYDPDNGHYAGPVSGQNLVDGVWDVAEVEGTISYYSAGTWAHPTSPFDDICGDTVAKARWPSGSRNGPTGMDAETVFARPCSRTKGPSLGHWSNFEINNNNVFRHVDTIDGAISTPSWSHAYDYALLGHDKPVQFRLRDLPGTKDNYGKLDILVRPATFNDCDHERHVAFGFEDRFSCYSGLMDNPDRAAAAPAN